MAASRKILFLFLDGVGLGPDDPETNPFSAVRMPNLQGLLGGHKLVARDLHSPDALILETKRASLLAVDAGLGVGGVPQSASGQAALLTGINVPAWLGEHEGPKPTAPIAGLLEKGTIFTRLVAKGKHVAFLNAYPPRYFDAIDSGYRLQGAIAWAARLAGVHLATQEDLFTGEALSADFTGEGWRSHLGFEHAPLISLAQAGVRLNDLASRADLSLFEYWLTDVAGHHQDWPVARQVLQALDGVLGSLAGAWDDARGLVLLTSDHGNLEDLSTRHHTLSDVPLLLIGAPILRQEFLQGLEQQRSSRSRPDLTDLAPAIERFID